MEGKMEIAVKMKANGFNIITICQITGLTEEQVNRL